MGPSAGRARLRNVVRGLAPNMTLAALAASSPETGYFVIDPAEDCAQMADLKQLLTSWSDGQAWRVDLMIVL